MLTAIALPAAAADGAISAAPCGVAAGRDASNNTITCNFGLSPEQLKQLTEAAVKGATEPLAHQIVDVSKTLGVTADAAKSLLKIVGEDSNVPEDKLAEALSKAAQDYKRLQAQIAALNPDNLIARALVEQAKPEIEAGRFARARELLHQATQAQIAAAQEAHKLVEQAQAAADAQMLGAASSTAAEDDVALTERQYKEAADLFGQAAGDVPTGYKNEHGAYLLRQENALYRQGDELGDNAALASAIDVCERALADYPRAQAASDRAVAQMALGNARETLGERERGTKHLNEAVTAYRAALQERLRARVPLGWARTQMGLGNALAALGERESGTARLEEAVAAYRAALEEEPHERVPLDWAMTQNNLGAALVRIGERESGTARLEEAAAAFRAALEERTRERVPLDWASAQMNLGNALASLGERESGTARLDEAVAAYGEALKEYTRERLPLDWARTQMNLGNALARLGERESGTAYLEQAVAVYRAALEERTRERVPLDWATAQHNLGNALASLGERESGTARLEEAAAAFRAALEERTRERVPLDWAASTGNLGVAMTLIADRTNDSALAATALRQIQTAYETERSGGQQQWAAYYETQLPKAQAIRNRLKGKFDVRRASPLRAPLGNVPLRGNVAGWPQSHSGAPWRSASFFRPSRTSSGPTAICWSMT
jgi:tetratricopeptide (TPR) repeat protein